MQAYKQFGNSVCPLVVSEIGHEIAKVLKLEETIRLDRESQKRRKAS
jgi:hypothetical protein